MRHAATFSALVLSLLFPGCRNQKTSAGIYLTLLSRGADPFPGRPDHDGLYVMTIMSKRSVRIRHEEIRFENLGDRIEEVFRTRVERLILVRVEERVEFRDVIEALDRASARTRLRYGLITERTEPTPAEPCLIMDGRCIYTQYFFPREPIPLSRSNRKKPPVVDDRRAYRKLAVSHLSGTRNASGQRRRGGFQGGCLSRGRWLVSAEIKYPRDCRFCR